MRTKALAVGWLEPNGTFHPCLRTEHEEVAYNIIGGSTNAYAKGWIACLGYEISCGFGMPAYKEDCTFEQVQWLKDNGYGEFIEDE